MAYFFAKKAFHPKRPKLLHFFKLLKISFFKIYDYKRGIQTGKFVFAQAGSNPNFCSIKVCVKEKQQIL
jgi:hypothetical protein